jgi:hypothetical protein
MTKPIRITLGRTRGWKTPDNTVRVARPTVYGNPFRVGVDGTPAECVHQYRELWEAALAADEKLGKSSYRQLLANLRGKNLGCWCGLSHPCHSDVLLELANGPEEAGDG